MRLTARGIKNYQDKATARRDKREQIIMDLYAKTGSTGLAKLMKI